MVPLNRARGLLALLPGLLLAWAPPVRAAALDIFGMTWSPDRHALILAISGFSAPQARYVGNRLVIELPDAAIVGNLRSKLAIPLRGVAGATLRSDAGGAQLAVSFSGNLHPGLRLVRTRFQLALEFLKTYQRADRPETKRLAKVRPNPKPQRPPTEPPLALLPRGETDLETFPPLPEPPVQAQTPATPAPLPPLPMPQLAPSGPSPLSASSIMLALGQQEALDVYAAGGPGYAYPTGLNGLRWRQWFTANLGVGLSARVLNYNIYEEGVHNHTDLSAIPTIALRLPLGSLEPQFHLGYYWRQVNVVSTQGGTTAPFSPLQLYQGPLLGLGARWNFSDSVAFLADVDAMPNLTGQLAGGFPAVTPMWGYRGKAGFIFAIDHLLAAIGYQTEGLVSEPETLSPALSGIFLDVGWAY